MHFTDEQTTLLKTWVIKKLEDISDADADVLADYALALVSTEDSEDVAKANCIDNLRDFLPNNAEQFVDELFKAIATKSYDPNAPKPKPAPPVPQVPTGPKVEALGPIHESRKRSFQWDGDGAAGQNGQFQNGSRPIKQTRRGGRGGSDRGGRQHYQQGNMPPFPQPQYSRPPQMPNVPMPQHFDPLDPNNPMAMMAFHQFLSGMPGFQNGGSPQNGLPFQPPGPAQRCRDYDTKGFCAAGASCPFEHGNDRFVMPPQSQEYDPSNAMLNITPNRSGSFNSPNDRGRGGARGRGGGNNAFRGGGARSDFSQLGPNRDSNNTSIVVEQIPDDKLDEQPVQEFFSEFGDIEEITMHPEKKLAIVKYESKAAAKAAYQSPKVVFDNRFVKVYWYNAEKFDQQHSASVPAKSIKTEDTEMQDDEPQIDQVELARRQEEAQRKHDDARKQREETEKQKASLDEKLKMMEAERKKMAEILAKKSGKASAPSSAQNGESGDNDQNKTLKAQLEKLRTEAKELGIDPDAPATNGYEDPNGHNGYHGAPYRGRGGGYRGRGRGRGAYQPYRGGSWAGASPRGGGAVMRLDNRPKTISITFPTTNYDANDEALRQFLLFNSMDTASITKHPEKGDTALVAFKQRYEGENLMRAVQAGIPHVGKVEVGWYSGPVVGALKVEGDFGGANGFGNADVKMESEGDAGDAGDREMDENGEEQDLDRFA